MLVFRKTLWNKLKASAPSALSVFLRIWRLSKTERSVLESCAPVPHLVSPSPLPVQRSLTSASAGPKAVLTLNQARRVKYYAEAQRVKHYAEVSMQAVRDAGHSPQCFDAAVAKAREVANGSRAPGASAFSGLLTPTCSTIRAVMTRVGKLLSGGVLVGGGKYDLNAALWFLNLRKLGASGSQKSEGWNRTSSESVTLVSRKSFLFLRSHMCDGSGT